MTSPTESTMEAVMSVGPPPYDETTDIREGVTCYKCGKYVAKTWTGLWTHLRLRCLTEEEYNLAKTSWLHHAHRMEERQKEVARRRQNTPGAMPLDDMSLPRSLAPSLPRSHLSAPLFYFFNARLKGSSDHRSGEVASQVARGESHDDEEGASVRGACSTRGGRPPLPMPPLREDAREAHCLSSLHDHRAPVQQGGGEALGGCPRRAQVEQRIPRLDGAGAVLRSSAGSRRGRGGKKPQEEEAEEEGGVKGEGEGRGEEDKAKMPHANVDADTVPVDFPATMLDATDAEQPCRTDVSPADAAAIAAFARRRPIPRSWSGTPPTASEREEPRTIAGDHTEAKRRRLSKQASTCPEVARCVRSRVVVSVMVSSVHPLMHVFFSDDLCLCSYHQAPSSSSRPTRAPPTGPVKQNKVRMRQLSC